ncbi:MAG: hypothetical protein CMM25_08770 [Rhodospirillaceae bacterium]|nr:hypothetical protein [Rhodospirillaceae bacterium]
MHKNIQGLGWLVRRHIDPISTGEFYTELLGLPELRRRDNAKARNIMLWAGMYSVIETIWMGKKYHQVNTIEDAEIIPIFRARNIVTAQALLDSHKVIFVSNPDYRDETIYFLDPSGFVVGIRPPIPGSDLAPDLEAESLWNKGTITVPNIINHQGNIQDIGWLRMNVENPQILAEFYNKVVGLKVLENNGDNGVTLHLGGTTTLELKPGGKTRLQPSDRKEVPDVWIFRGYEFSEFNERMIAFNVPIINELTLGGGKLNYYVDPEGHVFGFQERRKYNREDEKTHRIEDIAARQDWEINQETRQQEY